MDIWGGLYGAPSIYLGVITLTGLKTIPQTTVAPKVAYSLPCSWGVPRAGEPRDSPSLSCLAWQSPLLHCSHCIPWDHTLNLCQNHTRHCPKKKKKVEEEEEIKVGFFLLFLGRRSTLLPRPGHLQTSDIQTVNCPIMWPKLRWAAYLGLAGGPGMQIGSPRLYLV